MKKVFAIILFAGVVAAIVFYTLYNKPHRNPADETSIQISAEELFDNFNKDETNANTQYLDKVLEVKGKVLEVTTNQDQTTVIVLETSDPLFGIRCTMNSKVAIDTDDLVIIKGICTGYLSGVVLTNALLVKKI